MEDSKFKSRIRGYKRYYNLQGSKKFINTFKNSSDQLADVTFKANFLGKLPKIWFEITMMIILTSLIFYLSNLQYDTKTIMSTMGIF